MRKELTEIELVIRDALLTINSIVSKPGPRYKGTYPQEYLEIIAPDAPRRGYVGNVDHAEKVVCEWFQTGCLDEQERKIIMMRLGYSKILPFRAICKKFHTSRELVRMRYYRALEILEHDLYRVGLYDKYLCAQIAENASTSEFF